MTTHHLPVAINLGDGNDTLINSGSNISVNHTSGNDVTVGFTDNDSLQAEDGSIIGADVDADDFNIIISDGSVRPRDMSSSIRSNVDLSTVSGDGVFVLELNDGAFVGSTHLSPPPPIS